MSELLTIRPLTEADGEVFSAIRLEALRECPGVFGSRVEVEEKYTLEEWRDWLRCDEGCMFGLFEKDHIIGITGVTTDQNNPNAGLLIASYIRQAYRGKGFSDLLYKARIRWGAEYRRWNKLCVGHRDGNEPSRRANQRHGFVFSHRVSKTWPDNMICDELCYELDLEKLRHIR